MSPAGGSPGDGPPGADPPARAGADGAPGAAGAAGTADAASPTEPTEPTGAHRAEGRRKPGLLARRLPFLARPKGPRKQRSFWKELPILIGIAVVLALVIKTFLLQAFSIPSDSMQNTLQRGDRVLVDKLTPWFGNKPERGEVVVFHDPGGWLGEAPRSEGFGARVQDVLSGIGLMPSAEDQDLIKRVIAVGGDTVECHKGGSVLVNGEAIDESDYLYPGNTPCDDRPFGPIEVPEGRLWVMGDHRQDSLDSRYHQNLAFQGTVSEDDVVGRAVVIAWPVSRWGTLPVPGSLDALAGPAAVGAPGAVALAGAVPLVLWRRRRAAVSELARTRGPVG